MLGRRRGAVAPTNTVGNSNDDAQAESTAGTVASLNAEMAVMSTTATELGQLTTSADDKAQTVAAASEQTSQVIDTVASATQELSSSLTEVSTRTSDTSAAVQQAVQDAEEARATMGSLEQACGAISDVSTMIAGVAGQTNLLALNATIEAARAGTAGKGFAVVASEVKELSRQTSDATDEIGRRVEVLIADADRVSAAIGGIADAVNRIGQMSMEVAAAVEQQTAVTSEIARSVTEAAASSTDVAHAAAGVHSVMAEANTQVARIRRLTTRLVDETASLDNALEAHLTGTADAPVASGTGPAAQLAAAVSAHGAWKARLMRAAATGVSDLDPDLVALDDRCALGKWLHTDGRAAPGADAHHQPILQRHAQFHQVAARILRATISGRQDEAAQALAQGGAFNALSVELVGSLVAWRDGLSAERTAGLG